MGFEMGLESIIEGHNGMPSDAGWEKIYDGPIVQGDPVIEGQIKTPGSESIKRFRETYIPIIDRYVKDKSQLRILEIGAGLGNATYGAIETLSPELYISSEPFVSLLGTLRANMDSWGYPWPKGVVAAYDANKPVSLKPGAVNLILGNSVLHHVLHWRDCLSSLSSVLDKKGLMVFGEPSYESWSYIITLVKSIVQHSDCVMSESATSPNRGLSGHARENLERFARSLEIRLNRKNDIPFLAKLEDKHLFSIPDLLDFANEHGLRFHLERAKGQFQRTFLTKVKPLLTTPEEFQFVEQYIDTILPPGLSDCAMGEPFILFAFYKP